ncbi:hypothetical protein DFH08DRAFT_968280 [Mycena albidolilacea]|uniref:Uncharacterized protein n=1 Tax=Mycena albidolilacea TaxID=1033008 RepID=A0AAD6ZKK3_9AGAR|nr:hypothetical protein DFH08DRAFT_968280 [Mycena albidolilacea]
MNTAAIAEPTARHAKGSMRASRHRRIHLGTGVFIGVWFTASTPALSTLAVVVGALGARRDLMNAIPSAITVESKEEIVYRPFAARLPCAGGGGLLVFNDVECGARPGSRSIGDTGKGGPASPVYIRCGIAQEDTLWKALVDVGSEVAVEEREKSTDGTEKTRSLHSGYETVTLNYLSSLLMAALAVAMRSAMLREPSARFAGCTFIRLAEPPQNKPASPRTSTVFVADRGNELVVDDNNRIVRDPALDHQIGHARSVRKRRDVAQRPLPGANQPNMTADLCFQSISAVNPHPD